jgi:hypothetical protein
VGWPIPRWTLVAVAAIVVVAAAYFISQWLQQEKNKRENLAALQRATSTAMAEPAQADIRTGLARMQTTPPCTLPSSNESTYSTTDAAVWFFFAFRRSDVTDQWTVTWIEPNGTVRKTSTVAHASAAGHYCFEMKIAGSPAQNTPGEWSVRLSRNGSDVAERKFTIGR